MSLSKIGKSINIGNKHNLGRKMSDETKMKISLKHKNRIVKDEHKRYGEDNAVSKKVIDMTTGVIFDSCKDAAHAYGVKTSYLSHKLTGRVKNKTNLIYI